MLRKILLGSIAVCSIVCASYANAQIKQAPPTVENRAEHNALQQKKLLNENTQGTVQPYAVVPQQYTYGQYQPYQPYQYYQALPSRSYTQDPTYIPPKTQYMSVPTMSIPLPPQGDGLKQEIPTPPTQPPPIIIPITNPQPTPPNICEVLGLLNCPKKDEN